jgi:hypothetical protein
MSTDRNQHILKKEHVLSRATMRMSHEDILLSETGQPQKTNTVFCKSTHMRSSRLVKFIEKVEWRSKGHGRREWGVKCLRVTKFPVYFTTMKKLHEITPAYLLVTHPNKQPLAMHGMHKKAKH